MKTAITSRAGVRKRYGVKENFLVIRFSASSSPFNLKGLDDYITYSTYWLSKAFAFATASERAF